MYLHLTSMSLDDLNSSIENIVHCRHFLFASSLSPLPSLVEPSGNATFQEVFLARWVGGGMKIPAIMLIFTTSVVAAPKVYELPVTVALCRYQAAAAAATSSPLVTKNLDRRLTGLILLGFLQTNLEKNSHLESYLSHSANCAASKDSTTVFLEGRKPRPPPGPLEKSLQDNKVTESTGRD